MALAGKYALVKWSTAASVALSSEAMVAASTDNVLFQISSTVYKGLPWDFDGAVSFTEDTTALGSTMYAITRLNGSVTMTTAHTGVIAFSGSYIALATASRAHEYGYTLTAENQTVPDFESDWQQRIQGLKDANGTLSAWASSSEMQKLYTLLGSTGDYLLHPLVVEIFTNSTGTFDARFWAMPSERTIGGGVGDPIDETFAWEATKDGEEHLVTFTTAG